MAKIEGEPAPKRDIELVVAGREHWVGEDEIGTIYVSDEATPITGFKMWQGGRGVAVEMTPAEIQKIKDTAEQEKQSLESAA